MNDSEMQKDNGRHGYLVYNTLKRGYEVVVERDVAEKISPKVILRTEVKGMRFRILGILLVLAVAVQPVFAQAENETGITPDSFLYGLDVALDKISLLLTFDQATKSMKGLEIARERLSEVRAMALENKLQAMERAKAEHDDALTRVESSLNALERGNSTTELEDEVKIEKRLIEHGKKVKDIEGEIKVKIAVKGGVTPEQRRQVDSILSGLENKTGKVEIEIENKKNKTKVKIKEKTGKSDEEVEGEVEKVENATGVAGLKVERTADRIEDATEEITKAKARLGNETNETSKLLAEAEDHLARAQAAFNESKYGEAFGQATAALNIAKSIRKQLREGHAEKVEEELVIEVEIGGNSSKVKVEVNGTKDKFVLNTTDREAIIAEIAARTGLSADVIRGVIKFEEKAEKGEKREKELEIAVEITDGTAHVVIKMRGNETEFTLNTTDNAAIIAAISERTGLSADEIEKAIKRTVKLGTQERPKEKERKEVEERAKKEEREKLEARENRTRELEKGRNASEERNEKGKGD